MEKGWFIIPGVRDGDRTLEEQMLGLGPALEEAPGKRVADLGCAEGLIAIEFAKAGAEKITAIEREELHIPIAQQMFAEYPQIELLHSDIMEIPGQRQFDIVLALAVVHKLWNVEHALTRVAKMTDDLLVFRWPRWMGKDNILRSKHDPNEFVRVPTELKRTGFVLERSEKGPRDERVQYWRRLITGGS